VGNLVEAALLAADCPIAVGEVFNLTDGEAVSKRRFIEAVCDGLGLRRPTRTTPLWLARVAAFVLERSAQRRGAPEAPRLTRARLKSRGLNLDFQIEKANRQLGYEPRFGFEQAMADTLAWYRQNGR